MTRIFDAFRKSRSDRPGAPEPPSSFASPGMPVGSAVPARAPMLPPGIVTLPVMVRLPEAILREMAALRVSVESVLGERTPRSLLLCGATAGEGATTIATHFAHALATDERVRVLLIDAHVRRPALAQTLDAQMSAQTRENAPGRGAHGSVSVLGVGEEMRRAGGFTPAGLRNLIEATGSAYDWIVIDGPPALEAPEAPALAGVTDGVVLVVRSGSTKKPVLSRAVDLLRKGGGRILGSVLNRRRHEIPDFIYRRL